MFGKSKDVQDPNENPNIKSTTRLKKIRNWLGKWELPDLVEAYYTNNSESEDSEFEG
jgi:hypothetical protein